MKAITLHEPWATLIACGAKKIETRDWAPPRSLIGERIAIHAARREPGAGNLQLLKTLSEMPSGYGQNRHGVIFERDAPLGCVVATAILADYGKVDHISGRSASGGVLVHVEDSKLGHDRWVVEDAYGDFSLGRYLWYLEDVKVISPAVPAKGHQGFWNVDLHVD